jgi:hypothetical protein
MSAIKEASKEVSKKERCCHCFKKKKRSKFELAELRSTIFGTPVCRKCRKKQEKRIALMTKGLDKNAPTRGCFKCRRERPLVEFTHRDDPLSARICDECHSFLDKSTKRVYRGKRAQMPDIIKNMK